MTDDIPDILQDLDLLQLQFDAWLRREASDPQSVHYGARQDADGRWWMPPIIMPIGDDHAE